MPEMEQEYRNHIALRIIQYEYSKKTPDFLFSKVNLKKEAGKLAKALDIPREDALCFFQTIANEIAEEIQELKFL